MEITLAPEQEQIVKRLMAPGKHDNAAEAVAEALAIFNGEHDPALMMPKAAEDATAAIGGAKVFIGATYLMGPVVAFT